MQHTEQVDLSASAEARLLEHVERGGGRVVFDRAALERQMVETISLLAEIDAALTLPSIIQDCVNGSAV